MWKEVTGPIKCYAGTSGTVAVPLGAVILNIQALPGGSGGSIDGLPDGQGGTISVTLPTGSNGVDIRPQHLSLTFAKSSSITFTTTSAYFMMLMNPQGF